MFTKSAVTRYGTTAQRDQRARQRFGERIPGRGRDDRQTGRFGAADAVRGILEREAVARIERQLPIEDKLRVADFAIDTSGTKESTLEQTREVFRALRSLTL